jgi:hypothetical protein
MSSHTRDHFTFDLAPPPPPEELACPLDLSINSNPRGGGIFEDSSLDVSNESTFYEHDEYSRAGVSVRRDRMCGRPPCSVNSSQVCTVTVTAL